MGVPRINARAGADLACCRLIPVWSFGFNLELMLSKRRADGNDLEPEICLLAMQSEPIGVRIDRGLPAGALSGRWNSAFSSFLPIDIRVSFTVNRNLGCF
jgi:hypothetical protein